VPDTAYNAYNMFNAEYKHTVSALTVLHVQ